MNKVETISVSFNIAKYNKKKDLKAPNECLKAPSSALDY